LRPIAASLLILSLALAGGCSITRQPTPGRPFSLAQDSFAYRNETLWRYDWDSVTGEMHHSKNVPKPDYGLHCFVMARSAQLFFRHARFEPSQPRPSESELKALVRDMVHRQRDVTIGGYANLHEFSAANERLLKQECGGAWRSYLQKGNWRMVFPFSRNHQARTATQLIDSIEKEGSRVVHVVEFPRLGLNHAILIYAFNRNANETTFQAYDPNNPAEPLQIKYSETTRQFEFPRTSYYIGGKVNIYQIYHKPLY
jgi:hypothetical protein